MLKRFKPLAALAALLSLAATPVFAAGEGWTEDFAAAQTQASEQGKDLMLEFTGSDWCPPCIELNKTVFSHAEFTEGAGESFVLVKLDFPQDKEQSEQLIAQNQSLQERYAIRGYPTVILADSAGRPYAETGFRPGGPEAYLAHLEELRQVRVERDKHMAAAQAAKGLDKAKHLHAAMQAVGDDYAMQHYGEVVEQIMALDPDNQGNLKKYYEDLAVVKLQEQTIEKAWGTADRDPAGTIATLDDLVATEGISPAIKQEALALKAQIQLIIVEDKPAAKVTLVQAIEADPESDFAADLAQAMEQFFPGE